MARTDKGTYFDPAQLEKQVADLQKAFTEKRSELDTALMIALEKCGIVVEAQASLNAPVDTGLLRKSITHRTFKTWGGGEVDIGTNVEYAPFMEFGTVKLPEGRPFLTTAMNQTSREVESILHSAISKVVNK